MADERRREHDLHSEQWWNKLNGVQRAALYHIGMYGFELLCVRKSDRQDKDGLAILVCNRSVATIARDGQINMSPDVRLRQSS